MFFSSSESLIKTRHTHIHPHTHLRLKHTIFQALQNALISDTHARANTHTHTRRHCSVKLGQQWRVGFNAEHIRSLKLIYIFMWVAIKMTHTHTDVRAHTNNMHVHTGLTYPSHTCAHTRTYSSWKRSMASSSVREPRGAFMFHSI